MDAGNLNIVATPIGNLEDISLRALEVLKTVDLIAAEDTRHSQKLLNHYGIETPLMAVHEHNEIQIADKIIAKLSAGRNVALISDAGTPLISDPGYNLVNRCREEDITVVPIPGACAVIAAICASGLPTDQFCFKGFLPVKQRAKQEALASLANEPMTAIYYEAPRRVKDTLTVFSELFPERIVVVAKELTKHFETFKKGTAQELISWLEEDEAHSKGEFVLMIAGEKSVDTDMPKDAIELLKLLMKDLPLKRAAAAVASHYDLKKNKLYQLGLTLGEER